MPDPTQVPIAIVQITMLSNGDVHTQIKGTPSFVLGAIEAAKVELIKALLKQQADQSAIQVAPAGLFKMPN